MAYNKTERRRKKTPPTAPKSQGCSARLLQIFKKALGWLPFLFFGIGIAALGYGSSDTFFQFPIWGYILIAGLGVWGVCYLLRDAVPARSWADWLGRIWLFALGVIFSFEFSGFLFFLIVQANKHIAPAQSAYKIRVAVIADKYYTRASRYSGERYNLELFFPDKSEHFVYVSPKYYLHFSKGDSCVVLLRKGALGYDIIEQLFSLRNPAVRDSLFKAYRERQHRSVP